MIGSTLRSLPYVDNLRKALESGTATAGRIQVTNATPEIQPGSTKTFAIHNGLLNNWQPALKLRRPIGIGLCLSRCCC